MTLLGELRAVAISTFCIGIASAADSQCSGSANIRSEADSTALSPCKTYTGDIAVATDAEYIMNIDGLEEITGTLSSRTAIGLASLGADSLKSVGSLELSELTILSSLNFPELTTAESLRLDSLPALSNLDFTRSLSAVDVLDIKNTFLSTLDSVDAEGEVSNISIQYNHYMQDITLATQRIADTLLITANGDQLRVELADLESAGNITISDASEIHLPSLTSIGGSLSISSNSGRYSSYHSPEELDLSKLETVGGDIIFVDNPDLTSIDLSALKSVGGALVFNGNEGVNLFDFPSLETVGGIFYLCCNFSEIHVPSIKSIQDLYLDSPKHFPSADTADKTTAWLNSDVVKGVKSVFDRFNNATAGTGSGNSTTTSTATSSTASSSSVSVAAAATTANSESTAESASGTAAATTGAAGSGSTRMFVGTGAVIGALTCFMLAL